MNTAGWAAAMPDEIQLVRALNATLQPVPAAETAVTMTVEDARLLYLAWQKREIGEPCPMCGHAAEPTGGANV